MREVNDILNRLRGEHFRREQNSRRAKDVPASRRTTCNSAPTLPVGLGFLSYDDGESRLASGSQVPVPPPIVRTTPGPDPPPSWVTSRRSSLDAPQPETEQDEPDSVAWRARALSLVLGNRPPDTEPPPLTLLCLQRLLASTTEAEFTTDVAPLLPAHLRRELMRYTALHAPLGNARLYALCAPEGHAGGELLVVGPYASLRGSVLRAASAVSAPRGGEMQGLPDWDGPASDDDACPPLQTFALLASPISTAAFLALPLTLTHLALVKVPTPLPIHRLPLACPLLVVLDLSFNHWLSDHEFARIALTKWSRLQVLGMRGVRVRRPLLDTVNRARWDLHIVI